MAKSSTNTNYHNEEVERLFAELKAVRIKPGSEELMKGLGIQGLIISLHNNTNYTKALDDIKELYKLKDEDLLLILKDYAIEFIKASKYPDLFIDGIIQRKLSDFIDNNIVELYNAIWEPEHQYRVGRRVEFGMRDKKIILSEETINKLALVSPNLAVLKFTSPLINYVPEAQNLHPIIQNLLAKTFSTTNVCGIEDKINFAISLSDKLKVVIEASDCIAKILEHSAKAVGDIFISGNSKGLKHGAFTPENSAIKIFAVSDIFELVKTIIHESTHKVLNLYYENSSNPYRYTNNASFEYIKDAMKAESNNTKNNKFVDNWLNGMLKAYPESLYDTELFPHFTEHIVGCIFNNQGQCNYGKVSTEFAQFMWKALQNILINPLKCKDGESTLIEEEMPQYLVGSTTELGIATTDSVTNQINYDCKGLVKSGLQSSSYPELAFNQNVNVCGTITLDNNNGTISFSTITNQPFVFGGKYFNVIQQEGKSALGYGANFSLREVDVAGLAFNEPYEHKGEPQAYVEVAGISQEDIIIHHAIL